MISSQKFIQDKKSDQEEQNKHALQIYEQEFKDSKQKQSTLFIKAGVLDPNNATMTDTQKGDHYLLITPTPQSDVVIKSLPITSSPKQKNMDLYLSKLKSRHVNIEKVQKKDIPKDEEQLRTDEPSVSHEHVQIVLQSIENQTQHHFVEDQSNCVTISLKVLLYQIGCLTPKINEKSLNQIFSIYGIIIKVIIRAYYMKADMKAKIVAYVTYKTKEQAQEALRDSSKICQKMNLKINQGQAVKPCYQYLTRHSTDNTEIKKILIHLPDNFFLKKVIDKVAKLVAAEGFAAEHYIMEKELENPIYAFLFLVWSVLKNKRNVLNLCTTNGRFSNVFKINPIKTNHSNFLNFEKAHNIAIDRTLKEKPKKGQAVGYQLVPDEDRLNLENMLRNLTPYRFSILDGMVLCMNMAQFAADIVCTITVSLSSGSNESRLARLYLISDILYNSSLPSQAGAYWSFHLYFGHKLPFIFAMLNEANILTLKTNRIEGEVFREKVMRVLQIWNDWAIYDTKFMMGLQCTFLKSDDQIFNCDLNSEIGLQIRVYENKLHLREKEIIERNCRSKGIPSHGSRMELIQRLVKVKDFKFQQIQKANMQNSPIKTSKIQGGQVQVNITDTKRKAITIKDIDGDELTQEDSKMIQEHKVQVLSYHDIECLHDTLSHHLLKDPVEAQLYQYINQLKQTQIYSSEKMDELCNIKRQELVKKKSIPIVIEPIYIKSQLIDTPKVKQRKSSSSSNSKHRKDKSKTKTKHQNERKNRSRSSSNKKSSRHFRDQNRKK